MKKLTALFIIFSIIVLNTGLYAKERRGADLLIQKKDMQQVKGELIAVKVDSLLLKESESGIDITVNIGDVNKIKVLKKSKAVKGSFIGLLGGAGIGALAGIVITDPGSEMVGDTSENIMVGVVLFGLAGIIVGGIAGAISGTDKNIQIEGKPESDIQKIMQDLRRKARIPDFQ